MSEKKDYYEVLGVSKDADPKELKQAFRSLARRFHPDKNDADDAEARFKEIQEAYAVLSDEEKRRNYDRFGHNPPGGSPFGPGGFSGFNINFEDIFGGDIFSSFFGGSRRSSDSGNDILVNHEMTLDEAYEGVRAELNLELPTSCSDCSGTGAKDGKVKPCDSCGGQGRIRVRQQVGPFVQDAVRTCDRCSGTGDLAEAKCRSCRASGIVREMETVLVTIPAGANDGMRMRMRGKGEPGKRGKGSPGDLYIQIAIAEHPWFERSETDLIMSLPMGYSDLVLGAEVAIPHVDGEDLIIEIPANSNSGDTITIPRRGMPDQRGRGRGDVVVLLKLDMPKKFSKNVRKDLESIRQELLSDQDVLKRMMDDAKDRRR